MTHECAPATSYEVALAGSIGPAFRAALATAGIDRSVTTSVLLLPASGSQDLGEIIAMLHAQGLLVLNVRRVPERTSVDVDSSVSFNLIPGG
jgi:hypothetical protein